MELINEREVPRSGVFAQRPSRQWEPQIVSIADVHTLMSSELALALETLCITTDQREYRSEKSTTWPNKALQLQPLPNPSQGRRSTNYFYLNIRGRHAKPLYGRRRGRDCPSLTLYSRDALTYPLVWFPDVCLLSALDGT
ncbi:hypothetical protein J6590_000580 [Homalodisca vitripennis]|nr:hypothetical protein J6590_000580 [Homalodisca vitripennis]